MAVEDGHGELGREHHEVRDDVLDQVADDVSHVHVTGPDAHHFQLAQRELEVDEGLLHEGQHYSPEARELWQDQPQCRQKEPSEEEAEGAPPS